MVNTAVAARADTEPDPARLPAAERILCAAQGLFHRQGIRATGIEEVVRAAGTTKMSLYRAFPSKDALVAAILDRDQEEFAAWFCSMLAGKAGPEERLRAMIAAFADEFRQTDRCGCPLLLAQAEFREPGHPTHAEVRRHKLRHRALVAEAAQGTRDPEKLADALAMVIDGAWEALPFLGGPRTAEILSAAAGCLIDAEFA